MLDKLIKLHLDEGRLILLIYLFIIDLRIELYLFERLTLVIIFGKDTFYHVINIFAVLKGYANVTLITTMEVLLVA
jgi:hypothetical protein